MIRGSSTSNTNDCWGGVGSGQRGALLRECPPTRSTGSPPLLHSTGHPTPSAATVVVCDEGTLVVALNGQKLSFRRRRVRRAVCRHSRHLRAEVA